MVQRKVLNKLSIKADHLKSDPHLHLRPSSPQTNKKMKKSRSINSDHPQPFRKTKTQPATPQKQSPNYMKSTSSFEARKERLVPLTPRVSHKNPSPSNTHSSGARTSGLKLVRTLLKSPSFKPSRPSKKCSPVVFCEDLDAQKKTCSSTLKDSKFPNNLQLNPGGTELEGTSVMKVCPYSYCSLNVHHHTPSPPLRCFLSARRRALKTHKSLKLGCLSPRQTKPVLNKSKESKAPPIPPLLEDETRDFFVEIYSKDEFSEASDISWEEEYDSAAIVDEGWTHKSEGTNDGDAGEEIFLKSGVETLYKRLEGLYDEESVSSEDRDSESDCWYQQDQRHDQVFQKSDAFEVSVSPTTAEADRKNEMDKIIGIDKETNATSGCMDVVFKTKGLSLPTGNHDIKYSIGHQQEETRQGNDSEFAGHETDKNHTIIYNIIQVNIAVFVTGERKEHSEMDQKDVVVHVDHNVETEEADDTMMVASEHDMTDEIDDVSMLIDSDKAQMVADEEDPLDRQDIVSNEQQNENNINEDEAYNPSNSTGSADNQHSGDSGFQGPYAVNKMGTRETTSGVEMKSPMPSKERTSDEEFPDPTKNLRRLIRGKKLDEEMEDSSEFNPRGPNFLPLVPEPDAETVDLKHQTIDERKNAEEWMVDFALQQAVTRLAPARKRKVALLVEAFEKVTPVPQYKSHLRHASKAFTNVRPMQACS